MPDTTEEKLLLSALELHPQPVAIHAPVFPGDSNDSPADFQLVYFNQSATMHADLPYSLMKGQYVSALAGYSEKGRKLLFEQLSAVYNSGQDLQATYYNEVLDIYFEVYRKKIEGGVLTIARNVSAELKTRQEKKEQEELVDHILNHAMHGWYILDVLTGNDEAITDFIFNRVNQKFLELSGLAEEQVMGKSILELFPGTKEIGSFDRYKQVYHSGESNRREVHYVVQQADKWYDSIVSKLGDQKLLVTFADVTEAKSIAKEIASKNQILDNIFTCSSNGISFGKVIRNAEGKIIDGRTIIANDAAIELTGIPRELFLSKSSVELEPNIIHTPYFQKLIHTMETGEASMAEYELESTGRWIEISLSRMDYDHLVIIFTNVTEIKKIQIQKEHLIEQLSKTNAALEEFTRAASHDLKEPIRKVRFFSERLHDQVGHKVAAADIALIEKVQHASDRMLLLVEDLLVYSDLNFSEHEKQAIDLNDQLADVCSDLELIIQEKKAHIQYHGLPVIKGYPRQMAQLFQNLISNSLKYSKADEAPVITISANEVQKKDIPVSFIATRENYVWLKVEDNGIGFSQKDAMKIFNVFTRLHAKDQYTGTGIGLSIVKKVVENHDGIVYATSESGKGSVFHILLPK